MRVSRHYRVSPSWERRRRRRRIYLYSTILKRDPDLLC
jgi:hypothetical protein